MRARLNTRGDPSGDGRWLWLEPDRHSFIHSPSDRVAGVRPAMLCRAVVVAAVERWMSGT